MTEPTQEEQVVDPHLAGLTKLLAVTRELASHSQLDDVLRSVTDGACEALSCERASLYLYDEAREELFTKIVTELEIAEIRSSVDYGITGWVARRQRVANIPDPSADARWNSAIDRQTGFKTRNILAAPLISQHDGRLLGVLQLLNRKDGEFTDFDEQLIEAFASHAATALERAELLEIWRRSQAIEMDIQIGRQIQSSFLPDEVAAVPGYDVATWWEPAEQVSGDYYDLFPLPDGRTAVVVADVSGHGIGPSLIMASARAMLRVLSRTDSETASITSHLAESITPDLHDGRFFTLIMAALDSREHHLDYTNAGHGPAFLYRRESGEFVQIPSTTVPLGFTTGIEITPGDRLPIHPGDVLVLATDGIIEARSRGNELFGQHRLEQLIQKKADAPAAKIVAAVRDAVQAFSPDGPPLDDMTMVVVKRNRGKD